MYINRSRRINNTPFHPKFEKPHLASGYINSKATEIF